jgi:serine/threonine protein kinase
MTSHTPPAPAALPSIEQFFRTIQRSGLLDVAALRQWLKTLPDQYQTDTQYVADSLVRSGKLSRFQAAMLLRGMARGLLLGPYQILSQIGKGGMGTVYLARDSRTQGLVALKILSPRRAREEERMIARFQREMELSRKVDHPHLCKTFESGVLNQVLYLAMEFIPGKSLHRLVHDEGPIAVPRLARLMAGVASALDHTHRQGLIHRDIKPSNIMVTPHDQAKLLDLGLALIEGEQVQDATIVGGAGYIVGTMDYISPEQTLDPTSITGRADLYSLGCTMYYALTKQPPFPGGTSKEKIQRHRKQEPTPLLELRPDLPRGFAALIGRLMVKIPAERVGSAKEAEELLLRWANEEALPSEYDLQLDVNAAIEAIRAKDAEAEFSWADLMSEAPAMEVADESSSEVVAVEAVAEADEKPVEVEAVEVVEPIEEVEEVEPIPEGRWEPPPMWFWYALGGSLLLLFLFVLVLLLILVRRT